MTVAAAALAILLFLFAFERLGVPDAASGAVERGTKGLSVLRDPTLSDDEKEVAVRRASVSLFKDVFLIGGRTLGALLVSLVPLAVSQLAGGATARNVISLLSTWEAIVVISIVMAIWFLIRRKL